MSKARIYARNLAANWIGHGASLVVLFFLSPFVVHTLGRTEYGIWSLLVVFSGYMGIFDLGVRASTGRHIMLHLGREDHEAVDHTIRTGLGLFGLVGLLILAAGVGLGWLFPSIVAELPAAYHVLVRILLPLMALGILISSYAAVFSSVLAAHDRFDLARGVDVAVLVVRAAGTVLALTFGYGLLGLTVVLLACNVLALLGNLILASKIYPRLRLWPLMLSRVRLRELFGYGIWAFVSKTAGKLVGQTDLVVIGILIGPEAVAVYAVGAMLVLYSWAFLAHIGNTFFPPVQRAVGAGDMSSARWLLYRQMRLGLILGVPMFAGFIVFGQRFIRLWMLDPSFPESSAGAAALVMAILAASKLVNLHNTGCGGLLAAIGHIRFTAMLTAARALSNLALSVFFVLVMKWGIIGVAAGTLASMLLVNTFVIPWYVCRKAGVNPQRLLFQIIGRGLFLVGLTVGWYYLVCSVLSGDTWLTFFVQITLALVGYAPIALLTLVPADDRKRVLKVFGIQPASAD